MTFGELVRVRRLTAEMSLREFCRQAEVDPSNWSKVERDLLPVFSTRESLERIARLLGIKRNSSEWTTFFDLASLSQQRIPDDLFEDKDILSALPVFFRTVRGERPSSDDLDKLLALLKRR